MTYLPALSFTFLASLALAQGDFGDAQAAPVEKLTWGWFAAPPYMMTEGSSQRQGVFDLIRAKLIQQIPGFQHKEVLAPFPRQIAEVKKGRNWCFVGAVKTSEREQYAYFSRPVALFLPFQVIALKESSLAQKTSISLEQLLANTEYRTSVLRGRSFNPMIDSLLKQHPGLRTHSEFSEALQMLLNKRLDYLIEFPVIAHYQLNQVNQFHRVKLINSTEQQDLGFYRVMCAKNPTGLHVIELVNRIIKAELNNPEYRKILEKWADENTAKQIRFAYDSQFLKAE